MGIIQFKLDGISIEVQYENGGFHYAITCGNGKIEDDEQSQLQTFHEAKLKDQEKLFIIK